jgi:hypothetical protein
MSRHRPWIVTLTLVLGLPGVGGTQAPPPASVPPPRFVTQRPPAENPVDWIFLIDTSKTMTARIDGTTILDRVKSTLREFATLLRPNDTLSAFAFDFTSRRLSPRTLATEPDLKQFVRQIDGLQALGQWTHTGAALRDGLGEAFGRPVSPGQEARPVAIVLFTDGLEDLRGIPPPERVPVSSAVRLIRDDRVPYVFYVSLGTMPDPALMQFLDGINGRAAGHGVLFDGPGGQGLSAAVAEMRRRIVKPEPLKIDPGALSLGRVYRGGASDAYIDILSPVEATVTVRSDGAPYVHTLTLEPAGNVRVGPNQWRRIRVQLDVAADATLREAVYSLTVTPLNPPGELRPESREIPLKIEVTRSPWMPIRIGALLLVALLLLAYFLFQWLVLGVRPGDTPLVRLLAGRRRSAQNWQPLPAMLEAREGGWTVPLAAPEVVVDAAAASGLVDVAARVRLRSVGNVHEVTVIDGPVRWRRPGEPFESLDAGTTVMLSNRSEIEMGGVADRATVLRYVGRRSAAPVGKRTATVRGRG